MRASDFMWFFLLLNASLWLLNAMGIYQTPFAPKGALLNLPISLDSVLKLVASAGIGGIVLGIGIRIVGVQTVGISLFAIIYTYFMVNTMRILYSLYVPLQFVVLLTSIQSVVLVMGLIQMMVGGFRMME